jgi:hypothetical protein
VLPQKLSPRHSASPVLRPCHRPCRSAFPGVAAVSPTVPLCLPLVAAVSPTVPLRLPCSCGRVTDRAALASRCCARARAAPRRRARSETRPEQRATGAHPSQTWDRDATRTAEPSFTDLDRRRPPAQPLSRHKRAHSARRRDARRACAPPTAARGRPGPFRFVGFETQKVISETRGILLKPAVSLRNSPRYSFRIYKAYSEMTRLSKFTKGWLENSFKHTREISTIVRSFRGLGGLKQIASS